jgi:precorrin-8X/cobalt-precorrin-8 methylmutase
MPLFDSYLIVDWSAANVPTRGRDSIWIGLTERRRTGLTLARLENPATRALAAQLIIELIAGRVAKGRRVLAGFDFPFGYPAGTARALGLAGLPWRNTWSFLDDWLRDEADNTNDRFDLAERMNEKLSGEAFPFWGLPREERRPFLLRRGRRPHGPSDLSERRLCELRVRTTQPVWKLAGVGAVGGQVLTGIPRLWQIRRDPRLAMTCHIWPFETGLIHDPRPSVILAEVYPSLVPPRDLPVRPKDAGQVAAIGRRFGELDSDGLLAPLFEGDPDLDAVERQVVETEEAWILGLRKDVAL